MSETVIDYGREQVGSSERPKSTQTLEKFFNLISEYSAEIDFIDDIRTRLAIKSQSTVSPDEILLAAKVVASAELGGHDKADDAVCASVLAYGDKLAMTGLIDALPTTKEAING